MKPLRVNHYAPSDLVKVMPEGYKLAVLHLPLIRKFTITWWVDKGGKIGRKGDDE